MFNPLDKEILDIAESVKKVLQKEVDEPRSKGEKDFKSAHKVDVKDDPEQDAKNAKGIVYKMSEGKMKDLHALVSKGVKDPKKIAKELRLPQTKEVEKAIAALIKDMKEGLDPVNRVAVGKKFKDRKDKDIDNDGDVDSSDEYLHKRRKAISKATGKTKKEDDRSFDKKKVAEAAEYDFLDEAIEEILESGNIESLTEEQLDEVLATVAGGIKKAAGAVGRAAASGAKKVANRLSTSGRADAAEKRADKMDKKRADRERLQKAKDRIRKAKEDQRADKDRERKAREAERKAAQQDREDSKNESIDDNKGAILRHQDLAMKAHKKGDKEAVKFHQDKIKQLRTQKESVETLDERNDALYLIYKDKIKAMKVNNYIKKTYRGKAESDFAPMDSKNFGVSVFADKRADKILKDVTKKFGKPDDSMMESV